jgi:hypothetical protein
VRTHSTARSRRERSALTIPRVPCAIFQRGRSNTTRVYPSPDFAIRAFDFSFARIPVPHAHVFWYLIECFYSRSLRDPEARDPSFFVSQSRHNVRKSTTAIK